MPQISFLNNLLLAILLKNFRWLFFLLRLNNPLIVQGVLVCLYVIQFTRYRVVQAFAVNSFSLSWKPQLVKSFFHLFSGFFGFPAPSGPLRGRSSESLHILPPPTPFVKHFLQFSSFFFVYFYSWTDVHKSRISPLIPEAAGAYILPRPVRIHTQYAIVAQSPWGYCEFA